MRESLPENPLNRAKRMNLCGIVEGSGVIGGAKQEQQLGASQNLARSALAGRARDDRLTGGGGGRFEAAEDPFVQNDAVDFGLLLAARNEHFKPARPSGLCRRSDR